MGFLCEKISEEDLDLFNRIGFKNWNCKLLDSDSVDYWCIDREKSIFFVNSGSFRYEDDEFYDLSYLSKIVRTIMVVTVNPEEGKKTFLIKKITIPKSIWSKRDDIIFTIKEAIYAYGNVVERFSIEIKFECEPELVEKDYNGR